MDKQAFYDYANALLVDCFDIMRAADAEYASETDKFANFKWQAEVEGRTPEQVAITFLLKHVRALVRGISIREPMEGRICDIINYALLIAGIRAEEEPTTEREAVVGWTTLAEAQLAEAAREARRKNQ